MSQYRELQLGETRDFKFTTVQSTGAPTTLAGSPVISAYVGNSTTEITAGITLSVDFDSRTGLNNVRVVATGANGYTAGTDVDLVITTGTVNSVSAVGVVVASFRIVGVVADPRYAITAAGTFSGTHSTTTADLGTNAPSVDISGQTLSFTTTGLARVVDSYNTGTGVATFSPALAGAPTDGQGWALYSTPPSSTGSVPAVNVTQFGGSNGTFASGRPEVNTTHLAGTSQTARDIGASVLLSNGTSTGQISLTNGVANVNVLQISTDSTAADNLEAMLDGTGGVNLTATFVGNQTGNLSGSVGSVTGAVGSVSGNVGGNVVGNVNGSVIGAVGSVTGNVGGNVNGSVASVTTVSDKTGYALSSAGITAVWNEILEGTTTARSFMRLMFASLVNKLSGAATTTVTIRDIADTKARITATVDADGNRTAVTTDAT